ncbi:GNAT family N-acetyltransferase [Halobacillus seohaensis]|uniref:GNAT family N-acetyltransferase n=1 Tax=Halobacillus seohaensis TaxID=447421 RepID=A0ABW2EI52_9BACI
MIKLINAENRKDYLPYLLLADENEDIINEYINDGEMYAITSENQTIGVCLFIFPEINVVEIKNIAIIFSKQGKGLGKAVIQEACTFFRRRGYAQLIVGTANSSIANIIFYQKTGFHMEAIRKNFFHRIQNLFTKMGFKQLT